MLAIAIGVHSCHLRKNILSDDGHVGCNGNTAIALDKMTQVVEFLLTDVGFGIEVITENGLHTGQGCITTPFSQAVHRYM